METQAQDILSADRAAEWMRDPYPFFAERRRQGGVFRGPVIDYSRLPDSMRPKHVFSALSFDAVNTVFRDGRVFNSGVYDTSIGLFTGRTILAMEGKEHRDHRNLVSAAFKTKSLARWEPEIVRPVCSALIDEFVEAGEADLVKQFTFEFPTRVISRLLGLPGEDLPMVPPPGDPTHQLQPSITSGLRGIGRVEGLLPRADRAAQVEADRRHHRRPRHRRDRRREAQRRSDLLVPAAAAARRPGDHLPLVGQPALHPADPPRAVRGCCGRPRA